MPISSESLREFLRDQGRVDVSAVADDTLLFSSGLVESFTLIELVVFIEQQTGTKVRPAEVRLDHLDSIDRILAFVAGRESPASGQR